MKLLTPYELPQLTPLQIARIVSEQAVSLGFDLGEVENEADWHISITHKQEQIGTFVILKERPAPQDFYQYTWHGENEWLESLLSNIKEQIEGRTLWSAVRDGMGVIQGGRLLVEDTPLQ